MKKLVATLLILCAGPIWAEWVLTSVHHDGGQIFYDPTTVKGGNIKKAWTKTELKKPIKGPKGDALSFRVYHEFDCVNDRIRTLSFEAFSERNLAGQVIERSSEPTNWDYVPPQTVQKNLFDNVCGKK